MYATTIDMMYLRNIFEYAYFFIIYPVLRFTFVFYLKVKS